MKKYIKYILLFILLNATFACTDKIDREWIGKTVIFTPRLAGAVSPAGMHAVERAAINYIAKEYKILLCIDSTEYHKFPFDKWKIYMEKLYPKVNFFFVFQSSRFHLMKAYPFVYNIQIKHLDHPMHVDGLGNFYRVNHLSDNPAFRCFLLDSDNKILATGNPVDNSKIRELYEKIINGEESDPLPVTALEFEPREIELENLQVGKTSDTVFTLKNVGTHPLTIQRVDTSCCCIFLSTKDQGQHLPGEPFLGWTVQEWEKRPIQSGKTTEIKVQITPKEAGSFVKIIPVWCNTKENLFFLKINGTVKE